MTTRKKLSNKTIHVKCEEKLLSYSDLLKSCDIGLSTVLLNKKIVDNNLFPSLKTKEDYVAWLKLTKKILMHIIYKKILLFGEV